MCVQILSEIAEKAPKALAPLLSSSHGSDSNADGFNILGNSLLAEVDAALGDRLSGTFYFLCFDLSRSLNC